MAKLTLTDISNISGAESTAIANINSNSDAIETALENTLSRDGTSPNTMSADIDMNSNDILNTEQLSTNSIILDGQALVPSAVVVTDALLNSNNLSDVDSISTSRTNLDVYSKAETYSQTEVNTEIDKEVFFRNRITNPCMQISQENGNIAGSPSNYYIADEWQMNFVTSAGVLSGQRIQSPTLSGALDRARISVTTADVSLSAGEFLQFVHPIEGSKVADAQFGTANAKDLVVRFMGNFPAGTYAVTLRNSAVDRSFIREITAVAGVDTVYEVTFPGDIIGTWPTGDVRFGLLSITLATGSTFHTTKDAWQAGNFRGTSAVSNGLGAIQSFDIGDVGLHVDTNSVGTYGTFEVPDPVNSRLASERYYVDNTTSSASFPNAIGYAATTTDMRMHLMLNVSLRTTPTITATPADYRINVNGANKAPSAFVSTGITNFGFDFSATIVGGTISYAAVLAPINSTTKFTLNARM